MAIDRRTHDSDVMERVLGLDTIPNPEDMHTEVIDLAIQPWLTGVTVSAVELTSSFVKPRRSKLRNRR